MVSINTLRCLDKMKKFSFIGILFILILSAVAIAEEEPCCYTGSPLSINYIIVKYVGPEVLQPGDIVKIYDNKPLGLLDTQTIDPDYPVITYFYTAKEPKTDFQLVRNGVELGSGTFHTSCSRVPMQFDDQYIEGGEDLQRDWELISIDFVNVGNEQCADLECGLDENQNGIGDDCEEEECPDAQLIVSEEEGVVVDPSTGKVSLSATLSYLCGYTGNVDLWLVWTEDSNIVATAVFENIPPGTINQKATIVFETGYSEIDPEHILTILADYTPYGYPEECAEVIVLENVPFEHKTPPVPEFTGMGIFLILLTVVVGYFAIIAPMRKN